jgi:hypothetical protein
MESMGRAAVRQFGVQNSVSKFRPPQDSPFNLTDSWYLVNIHTWDTLELIAGRAALQGNFELDHVKIQCSTPSFTKTEHRLGQHRSRRPNRTITPSLPPFPILPHHLRSSNKTCQRQRPRNLHISRRRRRQRRRRRRTRLTHRNHSCRPT